MRAIALVLGLLIAITVGVITLLTAIVDAEFVLDTAAETLRHEGIEIQHNNESTLTIFPSLELTIPSAIFTISESDMPAQRVTIYPVWSFLLTLVLSCLGFSSLAIFFAYLARKLQDKEEKDNLELAKNHWIDE